MNEWYPCDLSQLWGTGLGGSQFNRIEYIQYIWSNYSDLTRPHPKWWFSKGNPLISGKSRLVKYYNLARYIWDVCQMPFAKCWTMRHLLGLTVCQIDTLMLVSIALQVWMKWIGVSTCGQFSACWNGALIHPTYGTPGLRPRPRLRESIESIHHPLYEKYFFPSAWI